MGGLFLGHGMKVKPYEFLEKEDFAVYLAWSLIENFAVSWILCPVRRLLYAAFIIGLKQFLKNKNNRQ